MAGSEVGIILALLSGLFIGLSLILQKMGINEMKEVSESTGNETAYLKSPRWWAGISCMIVGELANFGAYAFSPAIIVTPLGAVSVVVCAILSYAFLGEKLSFSGIMGIVLCIIGVIIVIHAPPSTQTQTIPEFFAYVISPGFLVYSGLILCLMAYLVYYAGPRYGKTQPIVYISITSLGGAFLVNAAQGFGSSVVYTIANQGDSDKNQFLKWPIYPLIVIILCSAVFQIAYLNKALQYFSASVITPINYVFFATATLVTSSILFRGFNVERVADGVSVVLGFLVIVIGVSLIFQFNLKLNKINAAKTLAEEEAAARSRTDIDNSSTDEHDQENDHDPLSLWVQTFPLRRSGLPRVPGRSITMPNVFDLFPDRNSNSSSPTRRIDMTEMAPIALKENEKLLDHEVVTRSVTSQRITDSTASVTPLNRASDTI